MQRIKVVDSHTGGEPTRVVVEGGPDLGGGPLAERRERFRARVRPLPLRDASTSRAAPIVIVGALLCEPATIRPAPRA